jgi:alpha-beta hydrolase superfamily lysophospholipase
MACQMGPRGKVTSFTNAQGMKLACYFWPAAARAQAVVQLLHGDAGYAMRFLHSQVVAPSPHPARRQSTYLCDDTT